MVTFKRTPMGIASILLEQHRNPWAIFCRLWWYVGYTQGVP